MPRKYSSNADYWPMVSMPKTIPINILLSLSIQLFIFTNPSQADAIMGTIPSIEVAGSATETRLPDSADVSLRIVARAPSVPAAIREVSARVGQVLNKLKNARIEDADIESDGPSVEAEYEIVRNQTGQRSTEQRRQNGYSASYNLTATTKDLDGLPDLLPQLAEAGALLQGVRFSLSDADARALALDEQAVRNAVDRAHRVIRASGSKPGRILKISTGDEENSEVRRASSPVFSPTGKQDETINITLPVRPGRITIHVSRTVTVEIVAP